MLVRQLTKEIFRFMKTDLSVPFKPRRALPFILASFGLNAPPPALRFGKGVFKQLAIFAALVLLALPSINSFAYDVGAAQNEHSSFACPEFFLNGLPPRVLNTKLQSGYRQLCFKGFALGYSAISRTPLWSAEHLTRESLRQAKGLRRVNAFHEETRLPEQERAFLSDYAHSGFDRGHMSPSADQPSEGAQEESFSLANMVPQNANNNRHIWEGIESATRTWAKSQGELFILTGPLFLGSQVQQLRGRVMVPTHLFKLIYDPQQRKASAYIVLNEATDDYKVISLKELEKLSGIDMMPFLQADQKNVVINLPKPTPHRERTNSGWD
jgi:endonuclease G